ncbi:fructosamine kinase family protein [Frateuria defendens]|uniref:fructosamine kinase family protein n=1 Tax=Frateuria defendens TaxID=2219559 RepID=UPI00066FB76C|nr:fructosamine kinase family protein [Frateuria defendens]
MDDAGHVERMLGRRPVRLLPVGGGDIARSLCAVFADGERAMIKCARAGQPSLRLEARMLADLRAAGLPVPDVLGGDDTLLGLAWIEHAPGGLDAGAQREAGRAIARLHAAPAGERYGYRYDTVIGSLHQPNPSTASWLAFFRDQRLLHRADHALAAGRLPAALRRRLDTLAGRLEHWLDEPAMPSLVHGDLWGGNMLGRRGALAAFIDPALYHGHGEVDLAMAMLFDSVGAPFFQGYAEVRELAPGFFERRCELYNLYPLLVHVELFGGSYVGAVERTLARFGC